MWEIIKHGPMAIFQKTKNTLVKNFLSLVSVQIANYLLPLVVVPYLARVIGVQKFGTIAFAQAIAFYFTVFTTFGFHLYAPKEISVHRASHRDLRKIFWDILYTRAVLCAVAFCVYVMLILKVSRFNAELPLFAFSFFYVLANVLSPNWFFQGMERMTFIALFSLVMKVMYAVLIISLIRKADQYYLVPLLGGGAEVITSLAALSVIVFRFRIGFMKPSLERTVLVVKKSFVLFISNISTSIYTRIPSVFLGFFAGDLYLGFYSAAEKIFYALIGIQNQLGMTLYPHVSKMAGDRGREETLRFVKKTLVVTMMLAVPATLLCLIFAGPIIRFLYGSDFVDAVLVLRILSFLFIIIGISNVIGLQVMLPFDLSKQFSLAVVSAGVVNVIGGYFMVVSYRHVGAALSFLVAEVWVMVSMYFLTRMKGINVFSGMHAVRLIQEIFS